MKVNDAVTTRLFKILKEKNITKYGLAKASAMPVNTIKTLYRKRNDGINLKTVFLIINGLNMTAKEFFDDPLFDYENLDI